MSRKKEQELRDPTLEELHNGPGREELPEHVRALSKDETSCGFCGVSYLIFSEFKELQKKLQGLDAERKALEQESQALKGQVATLGAQVNSQSGQLKELTMGRAEAEEHYRRSLTDCERQWAQKLMLLREELSNAALSAQQELSAKIVELQRQLAELRSHHKKQSVAVYAETKERIEVLRRQQHELRREATEVSISQEALITRLRDEVGVQLRHMLRRSEELNREKEAEKGWQQQLDKDNSDLRKKLETALKDGRTFQHQWQALDEEHNRLKEELEASRKRHEAELVALEEQVRTGTLDRETMKDKLVALEMDKSNLKEQLAKEKREIFSLKHETALLAAQLTEQQEHGKRTTSEVQTRIEVLNTANLELRHCLKEKEATWQERDREMEARHEKLQEQLKDKQQQLQDLQTQFDAAANREKTLLAKFEKLSTVNKELALSKESDNQKIVKELARLSQEKLKLEDLHARLNAEQEEHKQQNEALRASNLKLQASLAQSSQAIQLHETEKQQLQAKLRDMELSITAKEKEIRLLQATVHRECMERTVYMDELKSLKAQLSAGGGESSSISSQRLPYIPNSSTSSSGRSISLRSKGDDMEVQSLNGEGEQEPAISKKTDDPALEERSSLELGYEAMRKGSIRAQRRGSRR